MDCKDGVEMEEGTKTLVFKDSNLVSKSNSIIEASYKLGLVEQKVIATIASNISPSDKDFQTYTLSVKEFTVLTGSKARSMYSDMERIVKNLMQPFSFINSEGKKTTIAWLSKATYNTGEGTVTVRFDPDLKPFFLLLNEKFTRYRLGNIIRLRSSYSIRLFELLKSYEGLTERTFTLDDLRSKLGVGDKYPKWINFRQRILDHAMKEIGEKTDIVFEYTTIKKGPSINAVKFKIRSNPNVKIKNKVIENKVSKVVENDEVLEIQKLGQEMGLKLSKKVISAWLQYGRENVVTLMESIRYKSSVDNPIGYISSVLPKLKENEVSEEAENDIIQKVVRQVIIEHIPKKKVNKIDMLPDWQIQLNAIETFSKFMTDAEALDLWNKKGKEITNEINEQRFKMIH